MRGRVCSACGELSVLPGQLTCQECAARGVSQMVETVRMVECLTCLGQGHADINSRRACPACGGSGSVSESQRRSQEVLPALEPVGLEACPACDGSGCRFDGGSGQVSHMKAEAIRELLT